MRVRRVCAAEGRRTMRAVRLRGDEARQGGGGVGGFVSSTEMNVVSILVPIAP